MQLLSQLVIRVKCIIFEFINDPAEEIYIQISIGQRYHPAFAKAPWMLSRSSCYQRKTHDRLF